MFSQRHPAAPALHPTLGARLRRTLGLLLAGFALSASAADTPRAASANDRYFDQIQVLNCPQDAQRYGKFHDYGYWAGGPWCGQTGRPGYWVYLRPNWYVWRHEVPAAASVNGKYRSLRQVLPCPEDRKRYGRQHDYGYWEGGPWCGRKGRSGYWVFAEPNWYVWQETR